MKKQVLHIHGGESFENYDDFLHWLKAVELWHLPREAEGEPRKSWTGSLAEELGSEYEVIMPRMPNSQNAKYEEWKIWFERHFDYLRDGVVLTGLSLGAMFLAKYLSQNDLPFKPSGVVLLAGAYDIQGLDISNCGDFLVTPESVRPILQKGHKVIIMHSKDDFVVPFEHGKALAESLPEATFVTFEDKNHFLIEEFPEIIEQIRAL